MNRSDLIERVARERVKFIFFWGHQPSADGQLTASCLSQWWPSPFEVDGERYATAEHYMMAAKAQIFGDEQMRGHILRAQSPAEAKKLGRKVKGFDGATWDAHKVRVVTEASVAKFGSDPALRSYLLGTGTRVLVEASPVDRIWGVGLSADDPKISNPQLWRGENLLGFALMSARETLRGQ